MTPRFDPCIKLGLPLLGHKREFLGLDHAKRWHDCDAGYGVVCPCGECQTCNEYEGDAATPQTASPP